MKSKYLIIDIIGILVVLSILMVSGYIIPVEAQNANDLLVNGDFSNDLAGWNINVTLHVNYTWYSKFEGRSGVVVIESNSTIGARFDIYQIITTGKNISAVFTTDIYSNSSCSDCYVDVFIYNPNTSQYFLIDRIYFGNWSGWREFQKNVNVPSGVWEFYIIVDSYDGIFTIGIDSVHLLTSNSIDTMGGFGEDLEKYWYIVAYLPVIIVIVGGIGYFIEKKLLIRKLLSPK